MVRHYATSEIIVNVIVWLWRPEGPVLLFAKISPYE
ncbi:hypothetical protein SPHINGO391_350340 [Sphingomonas aurantiaca]|uniref:Uncharacterized protein n=1 Tax=Sphingomonas aurantiaca TaxID=185949 RepID=A0A5E7Y6C8_9SPHN|nr:hypothetical protein SPHINGO391_350340 [Sphingomonas aurantiaca]